jgi:opacity protein-like surface antigen
MKTIIMTLAAVSALTATAASAQPGYNNDRGFDGGYSQYDRDIRRPDFAQPGVGIDARQRMLARRIDIGVRNGTLTRREAERLRYELRSIQRLETQFRYSRPGLTHYEIATLDARLDHLSMQVRIDRNDRQYGYGYGDRRY